MNKSSLNLRYLGSSNKVEAHYDGKVVVHTADDENGASQHLVSVTAGSFVLHTLHRLVLRVISGTCAVAVGNKPKKKLKSGVKHTLPPGSAFTIETQDFVQLIGVPQPGPGLSSPGEEECILR